jgi:hypothetical protein
LKIGGRRVIAVGADRRAQELVQVTRVSDSDYRSEILPIDCGADLPLESSRIHEFEAWDERSRRAAKN